jgi:hypothetical protein
MSALTSSIAHEVGQPLSAMIHNAQALQLMIAANQATPEATGEILSDIRTQGCGPRRSSIAIAPCSEVIKWTRGRSTSTP